ncbi:hypothetical protein NIES4101_41180 [Calothrix sp. NIES-4101]|uniref:hypothetical protein n=1 Tax=Calothrix sp. UHCC 0171 TaxID=3110245 RepID=UPI000B5F6370|nr:hypothetical protein [Calothrix sp. UHCC 0171]MEA5571680.1 hypothetical protein [Calothrix sp. UHCC 0171]BAZ38182.1 hypothetical protein NIES4101_41180 [Calothrix sp. NIES-4101]
MLRKLSTIKRSNSEPEIAVKALVDKIIFSGKMSRRDHKLLTIIVSDDDDVTEGDRRQINRLFDCLQTGELKLLDW